MGVFDRLFGKKNPLAAIPPEDEDVLPPSGPGPIQGSSEFVRAAEMQQAYWTHDPEEQARLETGAAEQLGWPEQLRLHHLICVQRLNAGPERAAATEKSRRTVRRLISPDSPYRPRPAMIWQGDSAQPGNEREPDLQGQFLNPSLTHLGCFEVYRLDAANEPARIDFVSFDELSGVLFAPPSLLRAAKLFYDDGREEIVRLPLLYGLTWAIGNELDRAGRMTRFVAHLDGEEFGTLGVTGLGVGQQDLLVLGNGGNNRLFGLGSVAEVSLPLDVRDPRFDEKARARGIDPDEVRRNIPGPT